MDVVPREVCLRCRRPQRLCYCAHLPALRTRTHVVLLQHPREARTPIGTARMAHLALPDSELHRGVFFHDHARVNALLDEPGTMLLFPGEGALDPREVQPAQVRNLIVVDGTWWQARKVLKQNPMLLRLPRLGLNPEQPSNYRIRSEPSAECLATIEAISGVLGVLEGEPEKFQAMLAAFTFMVDQQLAHVAARATPPRRKRTRLRDPGDEDRLLSAFPHVVLVHAEVNAHSRRVGVPGKPELLHLVAQRTSGEVFETVLAPRRPLAPNAAFHLEVAPGRILAGETVESMLSRWQAFFRPGDLLAGWGTYAPHLCQTEGLVIGEYVDLRSVVARRVQSRPGSPAEALAQIGGAAPGLVASGRAGRIVATLRALVHELRAHPRRRPAVDAAGCAA
jgi:DTW domain-containing protein YfiP